MKKLIIAVIIVLAIIVVIFIGANIFGEKVNNSNVGGSNTLQPTPVHTQQVEHSSGLQFEDDEKDEDSNKSDSEDMSIGDLLDDSDELNKTDEEDEEVTNESTQNDDNSITIPTRFSDVPKTMWCYTAISTMTKGGLVDGYGNGKFGPSDTITIGQFAQILAKAKGYETGAGETGWWAELAVTNCLENELISDRGQVTQDIYDVPITREEAVAALQLATDKEETDRNNFGQDDIPDYSDISDEYKELIIDAYNSGITSGVDATRAFLPKRTLSRAEVCQLFYNIGWITAGIGEDTEEN